MVAKQLEDRQCDPLMSKPDWWPQCPYPESVFPMTSDEYVRAVPDPKLRTAISGSLGRLFWELCEQRIFNALKEKGRLE